MSDFRVGCQHYKRESCRCDHPHREALRLPKHCPQHGEHITICGSIVHVPRPDIKPPGQGVPDCPDIPPMPPVKNYAASGVRCGQCNGIIFYDKEARNRHFNSCACCDADGLPNADKPGYGLPDPPPPPRKERARSYYQKCPACEGKGEIVKAGTEDYKLTSPVMRCCPACSGKGVLLVEESNDPYAKYRCIVTDDMVDAIEKLLTGKKRLQVEVHGPDRAHCGPL